MAQPNFLNGWDTQQSRVFIPEGGAPTLAGADGGGGRNPAGLLFTAGVVSKGNCDCFLTSEVHTSITGGGGQAGQGYPCVLSAGFCGSASSEASGIGYQAECSPTIKTGTAPSILCLNDQGGSQMQCTQDITGTLRAQEHGHQPLVMATQQGGTEIGEGICPTITASAGMSGNNQPVLFENHPKDGRYNGPLPVAPTLAARMGTGGNNVPLVSTTIAFSLDSKESNSMKSSNPHSGCRETDIARTIDTTTPNPSKIKEALLFYKKPSALLVIPLIGSRKMAATDWAVSRISAIPLPPATAMRYSAASGVMSFLKMMLRLHRVQDSIKMPLILCANHRIQ